MNLEALNLDILGPSKGKRQIGQLGPLYNFTCCLNCLGFLPNCFEGGNNLHFLNRYTDLSNALNQLARLRYVLIT